MLPLAKAQAPSVKPKAEALPLLMELKSSRDTFRAKQDIMVQAALWAREPVTLCIYPSKPEASFKVEVYRAGYGQLDPLPSTVQLTPEDKRQLQRVTLQPGEVYRTYFNLKKVIPLPSYAWTTGEYRVQGKFYLCGKTEQSETVIPAKGPLHLLILD